MSNKYNLIIERGIADERIISFSETSTVSKVDLRSKILFTYDQGNLASCTANALCYCYIFINPTCNPSRLFLYYNERKLGNDILDNTSSTLSQGINALEKFGICSEIMYPYIINKITNKPPSNEVYYEAEKNLAIQGSRVEQTSTSLKGCLNSGDPFVVGILIYESFESKNASKTGMIPMPNVVSEKILGGHAVTCFGYDDTRQVWIMKNSWGADWGDHGSFYLPYKYLLDTKLTGDIWKISKFNVNSNKVLNTVAVKIMNERFKYLRR
jgi:C1A family cysteine protease